MSGVKGKSGIYLRTKNMKQGKYIRTAENIKKLSKSHLGLIPWNKGKPMSIEQRKRLSLIHIGQYCSEETKKKKSLALKGKYIKEQSSQWKGGITPIQDKIRNSDKYAEWRQSIFIRDDFTCQKCKIQGGYLEAHHIKRFSILMQEARNYMPLLSVYDACMLYTPLWNIDNGQTLCKKCHILFPKKIKYK